MGRQGSSRFVKIKNILEYGKGFVLFTNSLMFRAVSKLLKMLPVHCTKLAVTHRPTSVKKIMP